MVSFSPEGSPQDKRKAKPMDENPPWKPGSTPMQPDEITNKRSIEQAADDIQASESVKRIKKLLRKNPPLSQKQIEENERRFGK